MELVEGQSLAQAIAELRRTTEPGAVDGYAETAAVASLSTIRTKSPQQYYRQMARLMADAADALDYAHNQGVLHRDIKPANLMFDNRSHVSITDFGLARLDSGTGVTLTGDLLGTLRYMSPEQAAGKPALVDYRTDIHALGATLFELVALRPAFDSEDRGQLLRRIWEAVPPLLRQVDSCVPADLETIVAKAMEKDPADRYQSAGEMAADLRAFADNRSISAKPPTLAVRTQRWVRRNVALVILSLGVSLLALVLLSSGMAVVNHLRRETAVALGDAEASLQFARQAVDEMYTNVATDWLTGDLELTPTKREFLENAQRIYQRLADDAPDDPASQWEAGTAYARVAQIQHKLAQYRQAQGGYEVSLDVHQELLTTFADDPDRQAEVAATYRDLGQLHLDQEQLPETRAAWDASRATLSALHDRYPTEPDYRAALAASDLDQAGLLFRQGDLAAAERRIRRADGEFTSLRQGHPEAAAMATSAAREWQHVLRAASDAATHTSGLFATRDLAGFLAEFPEQQPIVEATAYTPDPPTFNENLVVMGVANGVSWYRGGSPADALLFLEDYAPLDSGADSYGWFYLAMTYHQLGKTKEARSMFQQGTAWMDANKPRNAELVELQGEAARILGNRDETATHTSATSVTLTAGEAALPDSPPQVAR